MSYQRILHSLHSLSLRVNEEHYTPHDIYIPILNMAVSQSADLVTKQIFDLYRKHGNSDYIGEPVSQQQHMIQCAMLAEKECYSDEVILGAFLHDIGHLLGLENSLPSMLTFGTHQHEIIGEQFLKDLGFPDAVTNFVRGHVDMKRYLVFKNSSYFEEVWVFQCLYINKYKHKWLNFRTVPYFIMHAVHC